jgi:hypothetical protein
MPPGYSNALSRQDWNAIDGIVLCSHCSVLPDWGRHRPPSAPRGRKQAVQQSLFHAAWILECFKQSSALRLGLVFLSRIGAFGITAATHLAFQTRISAYVAAIGSPRVARVKISTATEMLDTEWSELGMEPAGSGAT